MKERQPTVKPSGKKNKTSQQNIASAIENYLDDDEAADEKARIRRIRKILIGEDGSNQHG